MKTFNKLLFSALLLGASATVAAETQYVTDNLNTYLRKGAGDQFKIAGAISAGEAVQVLENQGRYSLIRDSKNREAWILNSELSSTPSAKEENPKLKAQIQELTGKLSRLDNDWQQQNAQLKRELDITKNKNRDLEAMLDAGKREIAIQWFIYGGSVLGVGLLIGLILPHILPRRRRRDGWS